MNTMFTISTIITKNIVAINVTTISLTTIINIGQPVISKLTKIQLNQLKSHWNLLTFQYKSKSELKSISN